MRGVSEVTWLDLIDELKKYPVEVLLGDVQLFADQDELTELAKKHSDGFVPVVGVSPFDADEADGWENPLSLDLM